MDIEKRLPFDARLTDYRQEAESLLVALHGRDDAALWRVKWQHGGFRDSGIAAVRAAALTLDDAQAVIAREYGFADWTALVSFTDAINDDNIVRFERAVEAVISGDLDTLAELLSHYPELARARSARRHRATLLHYLAANGVEDHRQRTPSNAVEIAALLLQAGAEVDALADMYDEQCTTLSMLVSSSPPHEAGLQGALAETLLNHGASVDGPGSRWQSAVLTALQFGFADTARVLAARGAALSTLPLAAGLGRLDDFELMLPDASAEQRQQALALAAQHGQVEAVRRLLDAGADPNRYNPEGFHAHSTPLHQAVAANHADVVRLLVDRGARLDMPDTIYSATPLGWAEYGGHRELAEYIRQAEARPKRQA